MMGRKSKQLCMIMLDMEDLIPQDHLLRKIKNKIDFDFIYDEAESYYSKIGRPSIDPVCLIKMLLIGYLYGVKSERRLEEEITLNIAYCRIRLYGTTSPAKREPPSRLI
jgi:transposase